MWPSWHVPKESGVDADCGDYSYATRAGQTNDATLLCRVACGETGLRSLKVKRRARTFLPCAGINPSLPHSMKTDSDSDHSPADDEKNVGVEAGAFESLATRQLPPDPDQGLSDAEKAAIVSYSAFPTH